MCVGHNNNWVVKRDVNKKKPYETQHISMFIEMLQIRCLFKANIYQENINTQIYIHTNITLEKTLQNWMLWHLKDERRVFISTFVVVTWSHIHIKDLSF